MSLLEQSQGHHPNFVYFGYYDDDDNDTKIGKTTYLYGRTCTYNTSHPYKDFRPYALILVDEENIDVMEAICLDAYDDVKARHSPEYNHRNDDNEWITIRPSRDEIERMLTTLVIPFKYKILSEEEITEVEKAIREVQDKEQMERKSNKEKLRERIKQLRNERSKDCYKEPLPYQVTILGKMTTYFAINDKGYMIEPCGSGKSFLSIYYTKTAGCKTIVIGTPSVYLQDQMHGEILEVMPEAIIRFVGGNNETPIDTIKQEIRNVKENPLFVITTYASCRKLVGLHFDMKIGDECHHLTGIERQNDGYLRFHDISSNKSLFMTATKKMVDTTHDNVVFSMDDEEKFGECIDEKSVKWAIDHKVTTDYKVIVLKATGNTIADIIEDLDIQLDDKTVEIFISAYMTLKSIETYNDLSHVLCYTNTTAHAELMQTFIGILLDKCIFPSLDKEKFYNKALHCDSRCILKDEVDIMKNKKHGIISCVYIFGEGFNLPKLNGVCFVENMVSVIRIIQCALRSARIEIGNPNKISYLLVPFIDHDDFNEDNTSHKKVRMIVSNLGNVDENIGERLFVNTLTSTKTKRNHDADSAKEQDDSYDFDNDDLELRRLRLRLRRSKDLKSKLSMEEEEYKFLQALLKEHNIKSKREYDDFDHEDKKDNIERYFKANGVWPDNGWYDLLSIDTSMYPSSKDEWKRMCKEKNIKSMTEYKSYCEQPDSDLPSEPDKLYHKEWTSSIEVELGISRPRRR
jgi:superfamily II DNA or RNA helicase